MAFFIKTEQGDCVWHIQSHKPTFNIIPAEKSIIQLLQADGDELQLIIKRFPNLPYSYGFCTWRGQFAQFIYDNL